MIIDDMDGKSNVDDDDDEIMLPFEHALSE